jgi:hypothetical protein
VDTEKVLTSSGIVAISFTRPAARPPIFERTPAKESMSNLELKTEVIPLKGLDLPIESLIGVTRTT